MARAFPARQECPSVPDTLALDFDLGVDCALPAGVEPFCEAPNDEPPTPLIPFGCVEPVVRTSVRRVGPNEQARFDASYTTEEGDNCSPELDMQLELPTFVCDQVIGSGGVTYGRPGVARSPGANPETNCPVDIVFPCTNLAITTKVNTEAAKPDLRAVVNCTPSDADDPDAPCGCAAELQLDFPPFNLDDLDLSAFGVCDIKVNSASASYAEGKTPKAELAVSHNPEMPCEILLDLDIKIPRFSFDGGDVPAIEIDKQDQTKFRNNRSGTVSATGGVSAAGGGGGGGGGGDDAVPVGDDKPCTDVLFRPWTIDVDRWTNPERPDYDESWPDYKSMYTLDTEKEEPRLTQDLECTFNRRSVLQVNACREIAPVTDDDGNTIGEDCITKWDFRGLIAGTAIRMWQRKLPTDDSGLAAGTPLRPADRCDSIGGELFPDSAQTRDPELTDEADAADYLNPDNGVGGCGEPIPYDVDVTASQLYSSGGDEGVGYRARGDMMVSSKSLDFRDFELPALSGASLARGVPASLGVPLFRLVKQDPVTANGLVGNHFLPDDRRHEMDAGANVDENGAEVLHGVTLQGRAFITVDSAALRAGRPVLDFRSDMELRMPAGARGVFAVMEDFEMDEGDPIDEEDGKVYIRRRLMLMEDGVVTRMLTRTEYDQHPGLYDDYIMKLNGNKYFHIEADGPQPDDYDVRAEVGSASRPFQFRREILTTLCAAAQSQQ